MSATLDEIHAAVLRLPPSMNEEVLAFLQQKQKEFAQAQYRASVTWGPMMPDDFVALDKRTLSVMFNMDNDKLHWYSVEDVNGVFAYVETAKDAALLQRLYRVIKGQDPTNGAVMGRPWDANDTMSSSLLAEIIGDFE